MLSIAYLIVATASVVLLGKEPSGRKIFSAKTEIGQSLIGNMFVIGSLAGKLCG
jgi:hypothetical protein